ncbi:class I SAM-dependent methyltransferase [Halosolutus amylolyticus]|uniref:Class I SAM-dependent methyltransferase n=1 Tax=Halosolutus amylolyticus TaxID=2932267 RepID=A0ABD5PS01_9EURY|nr:methyltransferase domain-containing protein [Halosolutus amylolyticus]
MATDHRDRNPANGRSSSDDEHAAHLERSRTVWDRWSDYYGMSERDFEPMREALIDRLALEPGDRVLEIGCGPGVNFERLRTDVGPDGELVAVDYSPGMVENARDRIEEHGWENVEVRRADATTIDFDEPFDAAIATLSLSVMPDARRTIETVYRSLVPGARFAVLDVRMIPSGPARILNPIVWRFFRWYANWNPDNDVVGSLAAVFEDCDGAGHRSDGEAAGTCDVVETSLAGSAYSVVCTRPGAE